MCCCRDTTKPALLSSSLQAGSLCSRMDLKARVDELAARREALEEQMAAHSQRLEAAGVGLHSSLVDAQVRSTSSGCDP